MVNSIRRRVEISAIEHASRQIAVVGYHACAGNPVDERVQSEQIAKSVECVRRWQHGCEVIAFGSTKAGKCTKSGDLDPSG